MTYKYTQRGFTLIELLVVVLIIGILAAIALPQYQKAVAKANLMKYIGYATEIRKAAELYYLTHGQYAEDIRDLEIGVLAGATKFKQGSWTKQTTNVSAWWADGSNCGPSSSGSGACIVSFRKNSFYILSTPRLIRCLGYNDFTDGICKSISDGTGTPHDNGYTLYNVHF